MTEKQKIFADEYLIDLNGTRAYKAAYSNIKSDNAAAVRANKLLKKKEIWDYIQQRLDEIASKRVAKLRVYWPCAVTACRRLLRNRLMKRKV